MDKVKAFFANKSVGFWLTAAGVVFAVVALALFCVTMQLQENMYASIVIVTVVGLAAALVLCYKDFFRLVSVLTAAMYLLAGCLFLVTQLENIGYAITNTNIGDGIMPTFVVGMLFYAAAVVCAVAAIFLRQEKQNVETLTFVEIQK